MLQAAPNGVKERIQRHAPKDILISTVVMFELYYGAYRSQRVQRNLELLERIQLPKLEFDASDATAAGEIRANLATNGTPIGPYDVLIAAQAYSRGITLVTGNRKEFSRVPGLVIEDWAA
jgi:tRNA(fMet)-specific endonuclease VapC